MRWRFFGLLLLVACAAWSPAAAVAAQPLQTGIFDAETWAGPDAKLGFEHTSAAGATSARLALYWSTVAPAGKTRPPGFNAADPADPAYRWGPFDTQVRLARAYGLAPTVVIASPPVWAQQGSGREADVRPSPDELRQFALAAATRYSGHFSGLPRIQYWSAWNEPNFELFLRPQFEGPAFVSPGIYRDLLNAVADGVKSASPSDRVIAGDLDPFAATSGNGTAYPALAFMSALLCVSAGDRPHATCSTRLRFDIWADHPYTTGGPQHMAAAGNVSLGDLPHVHAMVDAAARAGHVVGHRHVGYWVTEFSWDSNPPDPHAVPERLRARWVAEALYRVWRAGVTHLDWFQLRDQADNGQPDYNQFQSGLYLRGATVAADTPKLTLRAFRMPFVAFRAGRTVKVWGRTARGRSGIVSITQHSAGRTRVLGRLRAGRGGIFQGRLARLSGAAVGARASDGTTAVPFGLGPTPDIPYNPFGNLS